MTSEMFINGLHESTEVLSQGSYDGEPAVLTYNRIYGQVWLWVEGKKNFEPRMVDDAYMSHK